MPFQVHIEHKPNTLGLDDRIWVLEDGQGGRVEIWPARGFNAYRWRTPTGHELLYADPDFFAGSKPTRSGIPILFPFPNRIRDGRFTWEGKDYQLPLNDPSGKNAIHGFVHDRPWRVVDHGASDEQAWVTANFQASVDAPELLNQWPGDFLLWIDYQLERRAEGLGPADHLSLKIEVWNRGPTPLPFGIGFHPYFLVQPFGGPLASIDLPTERQWELVDCLPTGRICDVTAMRELVLSAFQTLTLDDLFEVSPLDAMLCNPLEDQMLTISAGSDFRFCVLFTPPHRQAICVEPYTCPTDAIHLHQQGIPCGWQILKPNDGWSSYVYFWQHNLETR